MINKLKATWQFFILRFLFAIIVILLYLILSSVIQKACIALLGDSIFNYIVFGLLSLLISIIASSYIGKLIFLFVNGWHIAALPYSSKINKKKLNALSIGFCAFKAHMSSFGIIFGVSIVVNKIAKKGVKIAKKVLNKYHWFAYLSNLPVINYVIEKTFDSLYDCLIYYLVSYTKPGIEDDASAIFKAIRIYLISLPKILGGTFLLYIFTAVVPKILLLAYIILSIFTYGFIETLGFIVFIFPLSYLLDIILFRPIHTITVLNIFSKSCIKAHEEEESKDIYSKLGKLNDIIASILINNGIDVSDYFNVEPVEEKDEPEVETDTNEQEVVDDTAKPEVKTDVSPIGRRSLQDVLNTSVSLPTIDSTTLNSVADMLNATTNFNIPSEQSSNVTKEESESAFNIFNISNTLSDISDEAELNEFLGLNDATF